MSLARLDCAGRGKHELWRHCWAYIVLSLLWLPAAGADSWSDKRVQLIYGLAQGNYLVGDTEGALREVDEILRLQPEHFAAQLLKARVQLDRDAATAALDSVDHALALQPEDLEASLLKALILSALQREADAIALARAVVARAPAKSPAAHKANELLRLLLNEAHANTSGASTAPTPRGARALTAEASDLRAVEQALATLDAALAEPQARASSEQRQQRVAMQLLRARLLSQTGQVPAATTALQNLLSDAPENREARLLLASLYTLQENWRSLDALIEPIASDPQLADIALYLSGRAALGQNRVGRARAQFEAALEQQATAGNRLAPSLHFYRGVCLAQLQREPEARRELAQAIEAGLVPETTEEAVRAAQTLLQVGLAEPTVPLLEALTLRGLRPTAEVWALLGRAQQACGQLERAISAYTEALQLKPQQVELLALRGEGLRQIGLLDAAVVDYTTALQIAPSQHALHYPLALSYLQQGQLTDAAAQMTLAAERQPERSDLALWQALLYYTLNDSEAAHSALQRYFKNCGTTPRDSAHYLNYSLQVGSRPSRALEQLQPHAANSLPLGYFYAYCLRDLSRKAILDFAGRAETPATARAQLCATLFWMAQHEYQTGQIAQAWELLDLALETQAVEQPEYQLARWQRAHGS